MDDIHSPSFTEHDLAEVTKPLDCEIRIYSNEIGEVETSERVKRTTAENLTPQEVQKYIVVQCKARNYRG